MYFQFFTLNQLLPLIFSLLFLITSIFTFQYDKKNFALYSLFLGSLILGYFIANLDPFLNLLDEQYHALVAKNLIDHPLKPTLFSTPLLDYDYRNWTGNYIWLHKQPLFLWQIALSIKLFGLNELSVRIPSIVLHSISTMLIYRIGKISSSERIGFYGALFFAVAYYPLELISGRFATDHNDLSFLFYVTASIWAWFEYQNSNKTIYLVLIGIFSGCAILVKWLVGLLIYSIWFLSLGVNNKQNWINFKSYVPVIKSLLITTLVFLPWQLFILSEYPAEAKYEFSYNTKHFFEPIENHGGDFLFHINALKEIYGSGVVIPFLYLFGVILFIKKTKSPVFRTAIISSILIVYTFYTIASTKMISFCIIVSPFAFLGLGSLADGAFQYLKNKIRHSNFEKILASTLLIIICLFLINIKKITEYHTDLKCTGNCIRKSNLDNMKFIQKLKDSLQDDNYVIFNANLRFNGHIAVMFYTNYISYNFIPDISQKEQIKKQSYKIAIFDNGSLPGFIENDNAILKVSF